MNSPKIKSQPLDHPDRLHLNAADGWLGLGDWKEANLELEQITADARAHPEVLQVRYLVYSEAKKWKECVDIAQTLVELMPGESFGWINRSFALRRAPGGSVQAAYDALLPAADRLKDLEQVTFNLACYSCQLGRIKEGREWFARCLVEANRRGRMNQRRLEALQEPDLKPLWQQIKSNELGSPSE